MSKKSWKKNWRKWKARKSKWQVRYISTVTGQLTDFGCPSAYNLNKRYARLLVRAGKNGGITMVAERMPKGD